MMAHGGGVDGKAMEEEASWDIWVHFSLFSCSLGRDAYPSQANNASGRFQAGKTAVKFLSGELPSHSQNEK